MIKKYTFILWPPKAENAIDVTAKVILRTANLTEYGIKPLDALHVALAETGNADYFCTCDDQLLRKTKQVKDLMVKIANPVDLVQEIEK